MKKVLFLATMFVVFFVKLNAQPYFQQEVHYKIHVSLDDSKHELTGNEVLEYVNHSRDTLYFIYYHLWPNAYSNNNTALAKQIFKNKGPQDLFDNPEKQGYIDKLAFAADGQPVVWNFDSQNPDICKLTLPKPLVPEGRVVITTPFHVKFPMGGISRMGHIGQSYQVSQWYPKPAVYDKNGWHPIPYLDQGEFYSEFGSFDVAITLPSNYIVAATGELQNASEIAWMDVQAKIAALKDSFPVQSTRVASSDSMKTICFFEKNVHDFAWFADKEFNVLKGSVALPNSADTVITWTLFPNQVAKRWVKSQPYLQDAVLYYSRWLGNYPYKNCTALEGPLGAGGGMEYPGITIVSAGGNDFSLEDVIVHEVGHNWFYGILGFNERDHPFLDEGINTFYELRYIQTKYPKFTLADTQAGGVVGRFLESDHFGQEMYYELQYDVPASYHVDQPLTLTSALYSSLNYGFIVYAKSALSFNYLRNYLGDKVFDQTMKQFYETWKFKHPQPEDLRYAFTTCRTDVSWFFDQLLPTTKIMDYKLCRKRGNNVLVKNKGTLSTPVVIQGLNGEKQVFEKWYPGFTGRKWLSLPDTSVNKLAFDNNHVTLELYRYNNYLRTHGIFRQFQPLRLKLGTTFDDYQKTTIQYIPAAAWNDANQLMLGTVLHNGLLLKKRVMYQLMPLYGFKDNKFAGMGNMVYNMFPSTAVRNLSLSLSAMQFAYSSKTDFNKATLEARMVFNDAGFKFYPHHILFANVSAVTDLTELLLNNENKATAIYNVGYTYQHPGKHNLYRLNVLFNAGETFSRISAEINYNLQFGIMCSPLKFRVFAGKVIQKDDNELHAFYVAGRGGLSDFEYAGLFPGRFEHTAGFAYQFIPVEGSFAVPYTAVANDFIISEGIEFTPLSKGILKLLKVYGNIAETNKAPYNKNTATSSGFYYEAGLKFGIPDFCEVYFPLIYDHDKLTGMNGRSVVRFTLNLKMLNPFNLMERIPRI